MTARKRPTGALTVAQLADRAHDAIHAPTVELRQEALAELLPGCGINGRRVAELLGLVKPRRKRQPVDGERKLRYPPHPRRKAVAP